MTENLSANALAQLAAQQRRPVTLVILTLDVITLRYATSKTNIVFPTGGNTYTAKAISYDAAQTSIEGQISKMTIKLDNTNRDMAGYLFATPFRGRKIQVWNVWLDAFGAAADYESIFEGDMERVNFDYNWMSINATAGPILERQYPNRTYSRLCGLGFGDSKCNQDSNADTNGATLHITGTIGRSSGTTIYDAALVQVADFWNYGRVITELTPGGDLEERTVKDFASGGTVTLEVSFSSAPTSGSSYTIYAGCPKDYDSCHSDNAWGPTADNTLNFGGFIHIPKVMEGIDSVPSY